MCAKNLSIFYPSLGNLATHISITFIPIYSGIFGGIAGALIHGVLILGAHCRSSCTILVWIIFAWMDLIYAFYVGINSVILLTKTHETNEENRFGQFILGVFYAVVNIIFVLWTILVAKSARREIKDGVE